MSRDIICKIFTFPTQKMQNGKKYSDYLALVRLGIGHCSDRLLDTIDWSVTQK